MNIDKLYDYILFMTNKDEKSGDVIPDDFNNILSTVNLELFEQEWKMLVSTVQMSGKTLETVLYNNSPLNRFTAVKNDELSGQSIPRPDGLVKLMTLTITTPPIKSVELVNEYQLSRLRAGTNNKPMDKNPVCVLREDGIFVFPYNSSKRNCDVVYIREPKTPYYDYCYLSNDELAYIPVGYKITRKSLSGGGTITNVYNDTELIYEDVTYPNYTAPTSDSLSVEIEWPMDVMNKFINRVFEKVGIPLSQADVEQYSQIEQQKGE